MTDSFEALTLDRVVKTYGATTALGGASLKVATGEVHALLGENGAGKSTTVKLLSGLIRPSAGAIRVFGREVAMARPADAHRLGIQTAFQEISLVPDLTVAQNMLLPEGPRNRLGLLRRREGEAQVRAHLERIGLSSIDPRAEIRALDLPQRQKIEIARAVFRDPRILLLDEPTSALSGGDIDWLGGLIAGLKAQGVTTIFISHRMAEVRRFCDRLTVLRNGKDAGSARVDKVDDDAVIRMIIGRSLEATFPPRPAPTARPAGAVPVLSGEGLSTVGRLRDASFALWPGEILGIAGLAGMGQQDLFHACFGLAPLTAGTLSVDGRPITLRSPQDAIRPEVGLALVPEERKTEGLFLKRDGRFNGSLPVIERYSRLGLVDTAAEGRDVAAALARVDIHPRAIFTQAGAFSGGNQQKIAIAKWLITGGRVLLMFDPTRGIDIGTKHQLYVLMRDFAAAGGAVLFYSTEITELVNLCDRVLVLYGGTFVDEMPAGAIDEERIMRGALGGSGVTRHGAPA
ncbi:ribose transport system ATP-binding protein [Methylobacterium sp. 174MFSha1.1]|uniref:sugar ABC transporter ATP-binding protein n=1 Tax=Methylobacterium sp. 174MFSha1.1 TaxID=1502749 RepID=UPI0008E6E592|nr:sugar ABC transporter ATP-binding protein [Methylobacterium sp. 174MFSha1.1]SFU47423.1 ribose transport system ATP-binding protein [Methylobacterium sp. 174MFSha1.1]